MDSYGDGWNGLTHWKWIWNNGYLEIDGVRYCEDFKGGTSQSTDVTFTFSGKVLVNNLCY